VTVLIPATSRVTAPAAVPAARWRRLVAFVIDAAILTLVTGALWGRLLASYANRLNNAMSIDTGNLRAHGSVRRVFGATTGPYLLVLALTIIVAVLYYWLLTGYWGTTIGKRSVGLWVVSADDRSRISLRRSAVRALVFVLGGEVLPLFFLIDNGWLLGDRQRQTLHDKVAKTVVVRQRPWSREETADPSLVPCPVPLASSDEGRGADEASALAEGRGHYSHLPGELEPGVHRECLLERLE
jgi:uncharacterized RDD family membrane protein YckC